jgi:hypothetical protein
MKSKIDRTSLSHSLASIAGRLIDNLAFFSLALGRERRERGDGVTLFWTEVATLETRVGQ